jgi:hypothetical protein
MPEPVPAGEDGRPPFSTAVVPQAELGALPRGTGGKPQPLDIFTEHIEESNLVSCFEGNFNRRDNTFRSSLPVTSPEALIPTTDSGVSAIFSSTARPPLQELPLRS